MARGNRYQGMSNDLLSKTDRGKPMVYQVRIEGHLGRQWADWFDGMTIALDEDGDTLITGPVIDQAALFGLLKKVRDLGIPLISVTRVDHDPPDKSEARS